MAPSCPAPDPGVIRIEEYCLLNCKSQIEEMLWSIGSGLVSSHMKGTLPGESISKN